MAVPHPGALRRIKKELTELLATPPDGFHFLLNLQLPTPTVQGFLIGPQATPYEGGLFSFSVTFPENYPFKPPILHLETRMIHPRVMNGRVCLNLLKASWSPRFILRDVLQEFQEMLKKPDFDEFLSHEAVNMIKQGTFELEAEEATLLFAH